MHSCAAPEIHWELVWDSETSSCPVPGEAHFPQHRLFCLLCQEIKFLPACSPPMCTAALQRLLSPFHCYLWYVSAAEKSKELPYILLSKHEQSGSRSVELQALKLIPHLLSSEERFRKNGLPGVEEVNGAAPAFTSWGSRFTWSSLSTRFQPYIAIMWLSYLGLLTNRALVPIRACRNFQKKTFHCKTTSFKNQNVSGHFMRFSITEKCQSPF